MEWRRRGPCAKGLKGQIANCGSWKGGRGQSVKTCKSLDKCSIQEQGRWPYGARGTEWEREGTGLQEVTFVAAGGLLFSGCRTWGHLHLVYPHNASPFSSSNIIFSGFFFRLVWLAPPKQQQQQSRVYALRHYGETLSLSLGGFILLSFGNISRTRYKATFYH